MVHADLKTILDLNIREATVLGSLAGLVLLLGGLVLQFAGSPGYKGYGWVLWGLGSLGIAAKIIRPFRQKQPASDQIGKSF